jgi:hypothetical protein
MLREYCINSLPISIADREDPLANLTSEQTRSPENILARQNLLQ